MIRNCPPPDPGSARQIVGKAVAARTQRTVRTANSIKKARADEAAMPTPAAPAETARSSKKSDKSRLADGSDSGHRIKRRTTGTKLSKAKVPKQTPTIEEDPTEPDSVRESAPSESNTNTSLTTNEEPKVIAPHPMNPPAAAHKPRANGMTIAHKKIKLTLSPMHRVHGQSAKRIYSLYVNQPQTTLCRRRRKGKFLYSKRIKETRATSSMQPLSPAQCWQCVRRISKARPSSTSGQSNQRKRTGSAHSL
jgi:hypothetical protein